MRGIILVILIFGAACSPSGTKEGTGGSGEKSQGSTANNTPIATCDSDEITDTAKEPNYSADYLHRWSTADGCNVRLDILMLRQGDEACGGSEVADVLMTWPLGSTDTAPKDEHRIFVKDPTGVFNDDHTTELYQEDAALPDEARDTGFRLEDTQLWMDPADDAFIYLVHEDATERWPLDESPPGCA